MNQSKDPEIIKWEMQERALERDIKENPIECRECSMWRLGGDMSMAMRKCKTCGMRRAKSDIDSLIKRQSKFLKKGYGEVWEEAWDLLMALHKNPPNGKTIYFDEDYFYFDLSAYFNKQIKETCTTSKETEDISVSQAPITRNKLIEVDHLSPSQKPIKGNLKAAAKYVLKDILNWFSISITLWYM